ncbi:hypothetical protein L5515_015651 [Caenorhabditis briggsae]|uniref:Uncharacterized protein n=1 Tax=Caenorhabditis briggsae TaxID=6238 RepID=A0AAE9J913_CAEBR|nr:hypothetical protein L5515_015651 [Caenorhabditis briggsae]
MPFHNIQQKEEDAERHLNPKEPSEKEHHRLPSQINQDGPIEKQRFENAMLDGNKNQKESSTLESSIPAGPNVSSRKALDMVNRYNNKSGPRRRLLSTHSLCDSLPKRWPKMNVKLFEGSKKPMSHPAKSCKPIQVANSSKNTVVQKTGFKWTIGTSGSPKNPNMKSTQSFYNIPLNVSPKEHADVFNGSQTTLTKNTAIQPPIRFKESIGTSRCEKNPKKGSHDFSKASKKIKKLQKYVGDLGEKQIREIRKFQEDESDLSCDEKMFLGMYPAPKSDPPGLCELLE